MPTPYKVLADRVINKLRSSGYTNITEQELDEIICTSIPVAAVKFKACKQDLSNRDNDNQIFNIVLTEEEIEILANFMYIEFLNTNYINVPSLLRENLSSRDFLSFSSANHLDGLINLRETCEKLTRQMISSYSMQDSKIFNIIKDKLNKRGGKY